MTMRALRLPLSLFVVARIVAPLAALMPLIVHAAPAAAQLGVSAPW
jgi:ABC-type methionine transport system permease subunit